MTTTLSAALSDSLPSQRRLRSTTLSRQALEPVECPRCSKRSIVKRAQNTYDCLNCSFHKQLPPVTVRNQRAIAPIPIENLTADPANRMRLTHYPPSVQPGLDLVESEEDDRALQPLVFAAIAVIFGIIFL